MARIMVKGKLHRVTVTEARLDYVGSITIDATLMEAADILPHELVHINSMANAAHWETYAIAGTAGEVCLNGCPARLFQPGDEVIILSLGTYDDGAARLLKQRVVRVDRENAITGIDIYDGHTLCKQTAIMPVEEDDFAT